MFSETHSDSQRADRILASIRREEARPGRGLLKIFFGMAPGVGKTCAMLEAAIQAADKGVQVIIGVAESAIRAVPESYYEGSLALGATHERSVFCVMLPAAKSGIAAGVILGIGRAIGETMAVVMIAGNQAVIPESITSGVRTLTANIVLEMAYAADLHRAALIATATVLFVFVLIINFLFSLVKRSGSRNQARRKKTPRTVKEAGV